MTKQKPMLGVSAGAEEGRALSSGNGPEDVSEVELGNYYDARKSSFEEGLAKQRKKDAKEAQERFGLEAEVFSRVGEGALAQVGDEMDQADWDRFAGVNQAEHRQASQQSTPVEQPASGSPVIAAPEARELVKH